MLAEMSFLRLVDLFQIVAGTSFVGSRPFLLHRGQQQANEYCDDRDNDEHFYQRESMLVGSCKRSGWVVFHDALLSFGSRLSAKSQPGIARLFTQS
jgi:hypothetical protein